jgi:hypothetical protein
VDSLLVFVEFWFCKAHFGAKVANKSCRVNLLHVVAKRDPAKKLQLANGAPVILVIEAVHLQVILTLESFEA